MTLIDFPGELAAIVFTQGCNFRCQFCYNPMLVWPEKEGKLKYQRDHSRIKEDDLFAFLKSRKGKLSGVVITGGEPTLHKDLPDFIKKIKDAGFKIKLDSNGTNPEMLEKVLEEKLIDYLAMDIKAPLDKYEEVIGVKVRPVKSGEAGAKLFNGVNLENIQKSIKIIKESGVSYEFRTTLVPSLHKKEDIEEMGKLIAGADKWYLQFFKSDTDLVNKNFQNKARFSEKEMKEMLEIAKKYAKKCDVRG